jgi:phage host-nuclease inhibitor protein Gam
METIETATAPKVFNGEEKQKLTQLIREGIQVSREIDSLREGLSDAVKALAEEFEVKPNILKKAIRTAYKAEWDKTENEHVQLENILIAAGAK